MSEVNPTGETYSPSCTRKGTTCLKSRYFTFNEESQRPTPKLVKNAIIINSGKKIRLTDGDVWYQNNNPNISKREIRKSTKLVITDEAGMIILGK